MNGRPVKDVQKELQVLLTPDMARQLGRYLSVTESAMTTPPVQGLPLQRSLDEDVMMLDSTSSEKKEYQEEPIIRSKVSRTRNTQDHRVASKGELSIPKSLKVAVQQAEVSIHDADLVSTTKKHLRTSRFGATGMKSNASSEPKPSDDSKRDLRSIIKRTPKENNLWESRVDSKTGERQPRKLQNSIERHNLERHLNGQFERQRHEQHHITIDPKIPLFKSKKFGNLPRQSILNPQTDAPLTSGKRNKSLILNKEALSSIPCRFDTFCTLKNTPSGCPYLHSDSSVKNDSNTAGILTAGATIHPFANIPCAYYPWCEKAPNCPFMHPKPAHCRYNEHCYRNDCIFIHSGVSNQGSASNQVNGMNFENNGITNEGTGITNQENGRLNENTRNTNPTLVTCPIRPPLTCMRPFCMVHHGDQVARLSANGSLTQISSNSSHVLQITQTTTDSMSVTQRDFNSSPVIRCE